MPLFDHFDVIAPIYDRVIGFRQPEAILKTADLPVDGRILDAGGGTGRVSGTLVGKASHIIVADLSFKMLKEASLKDGLQTVQSHSEALPFPNNCFERVIMVDALHHVCNQGDTAVELWRVLKPGGRIVIEEPDVRTLAVKFIAIAEKIALMRSHFLYPVEIEKLFPFPEAVTTVSKEGNTAWVVIEKSSD
ncbi:MAG: class I SAM-dependent methyltransferase [Chloroflexi bacterium]|nr:MAG: class I SAM-dependent methyltransferase [Chloroflexota bacterium]